MDKTTAAIGLFIGVFLIIYSIIGISGFTGLMGSLAFSGGVFTDNFEDGVKGSEWNIYRYGMTNTGQYPSVAETGGKLVITTPAGSQSYSGGSYCRSQMTNWPDGQGAYVEVTMVKMGGGAGQSLSLMSKSVSGDHVNGVTDFGEYYAIGWDSNAQKAGFYRKAASDAIQVLLGSLADTSGSEITVRVAFLLGKISVQINGATVWTEPYTLGTRTLCANLQGYSQSGNVPIGFDNYGENSEKGSEVSTGTLRVFATYDAKYIATQVTVSGPESASGYTTTDQNNPLTKQLAPGAYSVSGTYNSISKSVNVTITASASTDATLNFGGDEVTPPDGSVLDNLIKFLDSTLPRTFALIAGIGATGVCAIGLFMPGKKSILPTA